VCDQLFEYTVFKKVIPHKDVMTNFNKTLTKLLPCVFVENSENDEVNFLREILLNTPFFYNNSGKSMFIKVRDHVPLVLDTTESKLVRDTKDTHLMNYDGSPITTDHTCVFKGNAKVTNSKKYFGFENKDVLLTMLLTSINDAKPEQLIIKRYTIQKKTKEIQKGGCVILKRFESDCVIFSINLEFTHCFDKVQINSSDPKFLHWLTDGHFTPEQMSEILVFQNNLLDKYTKDYFTFQRAVENKIRQLVDSQFGNQEFEWITTTCYRPECRHNFLHKRDDLSTFTCHFCDVAEFCSKCCNAYHDNEPCNVSVDEATKLYILNETKRCPNRQCRSPIEKIDGCNHMHCTICNTHFCWLCNTIYDENHISEHYNNLDSFGSCNVMRQHNH
jgi:hypothetical protein